MESQIWESVKKSIKQKNPNNAYLETWFSPTELIDTEEDDSHSSEKSGEEEILLSIRSEDTCNSTCSSDCADQKGDENKFRKCMKE